MAIDGENINVMIEHNDNFSETTIDPLYEPMKCECGGHFIFENMHSSAYLSGLSPRPEGRGEI